MSVDQKIKDKLKKLLALSVSDNEYEANLAMQKAQALMIEYNLTVQDVAEDGRGATIKNEKVWGLTKSCQQWESLLGSSIANVFDGRAISSRRDTGWYLTFVATNTDLEIIIDLYERLRATVKRMSNSYVSQQRSLQPSLPAKTLHNNYRRGMVKTIVTRLCQVKYNTMLEQITANQYGLTGTDLVVVKNKAVDQRVTKLFPKIKKGRTTQLNYVPDAYGQGRRDGSNVNLHRSINGNSSAAMITA